MEISRPGTKVYNGFSIPDTVVIHTSKKGVEYYITGENFETKKTMIRYLDDGRYQEIDTVLLQEKIEASRKSVDTYWKSIKQSKSKTDVPGAWCEIV